jgi:hypothetical protein
VCANLKYSDTCTPSTTVNCGSDSPCRRHQADSNLKGASETRTLGHMHAINHGRIFGGMVADVMKEVPPRKVLQILGHSDTCTPSITADSWWDGC